MGNYIASLYAEYPNLLFLSSSILFLLVWYLTSVFMCYGGYSACVRREPRIGTQEFLDKYGIALFVISLFVTVMIASGIGYLLHDDFKALEEPEPQEIILLPEVKLEIPAGLRSVAEKFFGCGDTSDC